MDSAEFHRLLQAVYVQRDTELREQFDRSLSFTDALFDRWERAFRLGFGKGASIYNSALLYGDVRVGQNTWVGPYTILDGSGGGITIGDNCSISAGVHIYTHDTVLWALSGGVLSKRTGPVLVGNCVYIGSQCVVSAGVTIGTRCVVGSNSFVNSDVPDNTIVGGSPAKPIGIVEGEGGAVKMKMFER